MTLSRRIRAKPGEFSSICVGSNLTALVNQSTMVRIALCPCDSGSGPIKSRVITSQGCEGGSKG